MLRSRCFLLLAGGLPLLCPALAAGQALVPDVRRALDEWYTDAQHRAPGQWGVAVVTGRGEILWSANPERPLIPASTAKLFTTGFARGRIGGMSRQATRVLGTGHVDATTGAWVGRWHLEMNGDPTLERRPGAGPMLRDLAAALAARGIRELRSPLTVTTARGGLTTATPAAWAGLYAGQLYAPPIGPVTLHENTVSLLVRPGSASGGEPAVIASAPDGAATLVTVRATTVSGRRNRLRLTPAGDGTWTLDGTLGRELRLAGVSAIADRPERVLEAAWRAALGRVGIRWIMGPELGRTGVFEKAQVLAMVESAPFDSLASEVNRRSLNVGAELLLRWAEPAPTAAQALSAHVRDVVGPLAAVHLVDGSGLSPEDRVSPLTQALYLAKLPTRRTAAEFPLLLPANGYGTLRRLGHGVLPPGVVRAKTGTLDDVSALAGYLGRRDGVVVVSALYNGRRAHAAKRAQWELFRLLGADGVDVQLARTARLDDEQLGGDPDTTTSGEHQ